MNFMNCFILHTLGFHPRETNTIEDHAPALVSLLKSCLDQNLVSTGSRDEEPSHAKIAADVMSFVFLVSCRRFEETILKACGQALVLSCAFRAPETGHDAPFMGPRASGAPHQSDFSLNHQSNGFGYS